MTLRNEGTLLSEARTDTGRHSASEVLRSLPGGPFVSWQDNPTSLPLTFRVVGVYPPAVVVVVGGGNTTGGGAADVVGVVVGGGNTIGGGPADVVVVVGGGNTTGRGPADVVVVVGTLWIGVPLYKN
jgi:hypothetical protein